MRRRCTVRLSWRAQLWSAAAGGAAFGGGTGTGHLPFAAAAESVPSLQMQGRSWTRGRSPSCRGLLPDLGGDADVPLISH